MFYDLEKDLSSDAAAAINETNEAVGGAFKTLLGQRTSRFPHSRRVKEADTADSSLSVQAAVGR